MVAQWAYSAFSDLRNLLRKRGIEEEFGGFDGGADGMGGGGGAAEFAVFGFDLGRVRTAVLAAGQCQAADGGDAYRSLRRESPCWATCSKSFKVLILLVAWRWSASSMSSGGCCRRCR